MPDKKATSEVLNTNADQTVHTVNRQAITSTITEDPGTIAESFKNLPKEMVDAIYKELNGLGKDLSEKIADKYAEELEKTAAELNGKQAQLDEAAHAARLHAIDAELSKTTENSKRAHELEAQKYKEQKEYAKKLKDAEEEAMSDRVSAVTGKLSDVWSENGSLGSKLVGTFKTLSSDGEASGQLMKGGVVKAINALSSFAQSLKSTVNTIGDFKTAWDTRLHGATGLGHSTLTSLVKNAVGVSPFVKQSQVMENLNAAITQGISYNVAERSYLDTLSESIASTFDAFSETMDKIVRVQQADSTAARLGMEAQMNEYLNSMFQNTEYLTDQFDSVTSSLYEATSLMSSKDSIGFEYQVQKWLGSLYSVGMDGSSVSSIAQAIGQLASGDLSGIDSGAGKLLVMAASNAGLDYAKMLSDGLDGSEMNSLMSAMVGYLETIATDNNVVQSKMANIFGLKTSDIMAVSNLSSQINNIYNTNKSYGTTDADAYLQNMMSSIITRTSMGSILSNVWENLQYGISAGIAENPALYAIYLAGDMLKDVTGGNGIALPQILGMGTGIDLHTSVADLMMAGAMSVSALSSIGGLFSGLAQVANGVNPSYMQFAALSSDHTTLGSGFRRSAGGAGNTVSNIESNYVGNSSGDDVIDATSAQGEDNKVEAMSTVDESSEKDQNDLWDVSNQIYELLLDLVDGEKTIKVEQQYEGFPRSYLDI